MKKLKLQPADMLAQINEIEKKAEKYDEILRQYDFFKQKNRV